MRHGPHHDAQKSTTTGSDDDATYGPNDADVSAAGCSVNNRSLHDAQTGTSDSRDLGTRFFVPQDPHGNTRESWFMAWFGRQSLRATKQMRAARAGPLRTGTQPQRGCVDDATRSAHSQAG